MSTTRTRRIALSGILGTLIFIVSILVTSQYAHSFQNWYTTNEYFDWQTMAISHLGVSNLAVPFTVIIGLSSLLIIYFIVGVNRTYANGNLSNVGTSLVVTGFVALFLAFFASQFNPNSTLSTALHFFFAIVYFVCVPIGMVLLGARFLDSRKSALGYASVILGILAFAFGPIITMGLSFVFGNKGVAIPEFVQILLYCTWIIAIAVDLLRETSVTRKYL